MAGNTTFFVKAAEQKITWKDIFSNVFKKHTKEDGERLFMAGTAYTTPHESRMLSEWRKPWLFAYVALFGLVFIGLMLAMRAITPQTVYVIPLVFVGSLIMPLAVLLLMWEMNIPRNIPIYAVLGMFFVGGGLSLIFTFLVLGIPSLDNLFASGSQWAALAEEPTKLAALCVFLWKPKYKYVLNGILIGAAIGAGFAAIETIDYALFRGGDMNSVLIMRGLLAPGGHVIWAALYGGALAMAKGGEKLQAKHFADKEFLAYFGIAFALHFAYNYGGFYLYVFRISPGMAITLKHILLVVVAWIAMLRLIKKGVLECMRIPQAIAPVSSEAQVPMDASSKTINLRGLSGMYTGSVFTAQDGKLVFGRDVRRVNIVFPPSTPGISSVHCEISYRNGLIYLTDKNSSHGTFLEDGTRLTPEQPYPLPRRSGFYLASRENMFEIE